MCRMCRKNVSWVMLSIVYKGRVRIRYVSDYLVRDLMDMFSWYDFVFEDIEFKRIRCDDF